MLLSHSVIASVVVTTGGWVFLAAWLVTGFATAAVVTVRCEAADRMAGRKKNHERPAPALFGLLVWVLWPAAMAAAMAAGVIYAVYATLDGGAVRWVDRAIERRRAEARMSARIDELERELEIFQ